MAKTKISTLAKELNLALPTVFSFLSEKGISIEESPNTRVEDNVVELLVSNFKPDKVLKNKPAAPAAAQQRPAAEAPAKATQSAPDADDAVTAQRTASSDSPLQTPRIVGKINLDGNGNPVPKAPAAPKPEPKPEPKPAPAPAPKPQPKPAAPQAPKAAPAPAPKPEPKPVQQPRQEPKPAPAPAPKPAPKPEQPRKPQPKEAHAAAPAADTEIFSPSTPKPAVSLNIVGKIDLDALNQTTRPKKKGKEERRNGNKGGGAQGSQNGEGRKKRQRIGKDKVDIEKAGRAAGENGENGKGRQGKGSDGQGRRGGDNHGGGNNRGGNNGGNNNRAAADSSLHVVPLQLPKSPKKTYRSRLRKPSHALPPRKRVSRKAPSGARKSARPLPNAREKPSKPNQPKAACSSSPSSLQPTTSPS